VDKVKDRGARLPTLPTAPAYPPYLLKERNVGKRADRSWIKSKIVAPAYPPYLLEEIGFLNLG